MSARGIVVSATLAALLLVASGAFAQESEVSHHEISVQGTGFFTKDSQSNGTTQHSTNTGGLLLGYRYHFNRWLAAEASYGYDRNTQQNLTAAGQFNPQTNVHQVTGAAVVTLPLNGRLNPYVLAGAGALVFDPTGNAGQSVAGALRQSKAAFVYGGGTDFKLVNHLALRAEYRGFVYNRPDFSLASLPTGVLAHTAQPSAGLVFKF
jgi:opacity protein-like surface antigen